jgi:hypothetical protein
MINGKREGKGVATSANGDKYDGEWKNGNKEGKGVYTYANGRSFLQNYKDGNVI